MSDHSTLSLIETIYDTAIDADRWPQTLTSVSDHLGAAFMVVLPYKDPRGIFMSSGGETVMPRYQEHWYKHDTMAKVGLQKKDFRGLLCDWSAIGQDKIRRDAYYQDFRRDVGLGYCIGISVEPYPGECVALGLNLPSDRAVLDDASLLEVETVLKHLGRAMAMSTRLKEGECAGLALAEAISALKCAAAIVAANGKVMLANKSFEALRGDGIAVREGHLRSSSSNCQGALDRLIRDATAGSGYLARSDCVLISRPSGRRPLMARAIPLSRERAEAAWQQGTARAQALLLIADLDRDALAVPDDALRLLGLTAAESRVACIVGSGHSPREAAAQIGSTEGTVRNQLKQVFAKTSTAGQTELVTLINQMAQLKGS